MKKLLVALIAVLLLTNNVCCQNIKAMFGDKETFEIKKIPEGVDPAKLKKNLLTAIESLKSPDVPRLGMALDLYGEVAIVGDLHGDSESARKIITRLQTWLEESEDRKVLFLGDILDRGDSTTTLDLVLKFYLANPNKVFMLKGNHESCSYLGKGDSRFEMFVQENSQIISDYIRALPYAAVINNTTFASHAGIPSLKLPDRIGWNCIFPPKDWREFFVNEEEKKENCFFWVYSVLWPDFMPVKLDPMDSDYLSSNGRLPYYSEDLKEFYSEINKFVLPGGRRLNLQHCIVGHNHNMGPYYIHDLGDGQTFNLVISTTDLLRKIYEGRLLWQKRFNLMSKNEISGFVFVVNGTDAPQILFQVDESSEKSSKDSGETQIFEITSENVNDEYSIEIFFNHKCEIDGDKVLLVNTRDTCYRRCVIKMSPLEYAASFGNEECIVKLINIGADVNGQITSGYTALDWAAFRGRKNIIKLLIENGAKINLDKGEKVDESKKNQDNDMTEFINECYNEVVMIGKKRITLKNINDNINLTQCPEMMDYYRYNGLEYEKQSCEYVKLLMANYGCDIIEVTPLIYAVQKNDYKFVSRLLDMGADVNQQDNDGRTALSWAILQGNKDIIDLLLKNKAS